MEKRHNNISYQVRQSNHEGFFIPECVKAYSAEPLYIIVAHWCHIQRKWVDRNSISNEFHITQRRASFLISYMHSRANYVNCEIKKIYISGRIFRYEILVHKIEQPKEKAQSKLKKINKQKLSGDKKKYSNQDKLLFNRIMHELRTQTLSCNGDNDDSKKQKG
ncbi:CaiF/GrlA family transcriptional regulator [Salmonella enterica subsp. diarizonae]|nr:CaiF/GrlA family transcriptional regulator [Salmonella enterica subsp. diarizonae]ECI3361685.1 CaiF/GrlA family transcriptional regulator [Salmonella enterica subsp. diarizonae]